MVLQKEIRHYFYDYEAHRIKISFYKLENSDKWDFGKVDFEVGGKNYYDYEDWTMLVDIKKQIDKLIKELNK